MNRQRLGGGMRQAGIIAAPGIYALDYMIDRLKDDNEKAQRLARKLSTIDGLSIDIETVHTNIIGVVLTNDEMNIDDLINLLKEKSEKDRIKRI